MFLSYASNDLKAAERIATALRAAGVEVWLDKTELRGGDVWDRQIRTQIHECRLFIPVISANTEARVEGYFRREWKLAVERTHDMSERIAFLVPVVIDETSEASADVPERFRAVQWTALADGAATGEFVGRIRRLLADEPASPARARLGAPARSPSAESPPGAVRARQRRALAAATALAAIAVTALFAYRALAPRKAPLAVLTSPAVPAMTTIAVLPFVDISEKHDQEYFSDGLSEELLDLLAKVPGISVIARTSSFYFKGKAATVAEIASTLSVTHLLEGSVRRSGSTIRVTAELVRASDSVHLWSETYDRSVSDAFKIQDEIAGAVVQALRPKLLHAAPGTARATDDQTANPEAHNQYLLGWHFMRRNTVDDFRRAATAFSKAVELDPGYTRAYAGLAEAQADIADFTDSSAGFHIAREAAEKAIALAPDRADGYSARAIARHMELDFAGARADFEHALALDPTNVDLLNWYARSLRSLGELDASIAGYRKAAGADPLNSEALGRLGALLTFRRDYAGARAYLNRALELDPGGLYVVMPLSKLELASGHLHEALAAAQKVRIDDLRLSMQANVEHSLGDEAASNRDLKSLEAHSANVSAYQIAEVYAWRGDRDSAFAWLERAYRQRDGGYEIFKSDTYLEGLYTDPRYKALLREANLPE